LPARAAENPYAAPALVAASRPAGSLLLLCVSLAAVCLVLAVMAPGLGILAAIFVAPAMIRTSLLVRRRAERGKAVTWWGRIVTFLGSLAVIVALSLIAGFAALGTFCLVMIGGMSVPQVNEELAIGVAAVACGAVALAPFLLFVKLTADKLREE
jgi:hypothetical protein